MIHNLKIKFFQERLIKKLGENAHPFYFELPPHCPASVTLQPAPGDTGKPCGIDYEMKAFVGDTPDDKPHKRWRFNNLQLTLDGDLNNGQVLYSNGPNLSIINKQGWLNW